MTRTKVTITDLGYVGLSNGILLAQNNEVVALDLVYEQVSQEDTFFNSIVIKDLDISKKMNDVIVTNRFSNNILDVKDNTYTRDIFNSDS